MSLEAANPFINATVTASAGSGKTYMLVSRIVRILLEGAEPGGILALTFTRKAAGEMQQRLAERLYLLATIDDNKLDAELSSLGLAADDTYRERARQLYEFHQYCDYPVRTQTFHSFCQDVLARFPLEAEVPPGFDLLESSSLLIQRAEEALFSEAALDMNGRVARDLQALMQSTEGLFNLRKALNSFLDHRSDWWAFTESQSQACDFASTVLAKKLEFEKDSDPLTDFFNELNLQLIKNFAQLLGQIGGKTNVKHADELAMLLATDKWNETAFKKISGCFLTQKNTAIVQGRKDTPTLRKKIGDDAADKFLQLAELIPTRILATWDNINKQKTFELNRLWYRCGEYYVAHYQRLKQELRLLDFTDLEWRTYQLLKHSDNALWVQYKLDQRIEHFLIDEFQDTNPTQWQLILPILEEMASTEQDRLRSVFLVGDEKQSIYSFRRAKPELQQQAALWLKEHLAAQAFPLNKSWRSSPAVINCVNAVFEQDAYRAILPAFKNHQTHQENLPGVVELFPLLVKQKALQEEPAELTLRNPLTDPRPQAPSIYLEEGKQIAQKIQQLIADKATTGEGDAARLINYDDIYILLRKRSHVADYEQALRQAGIPYLGANKGTLLDCVEIQDMEALLDTLLTPFNNLALAQVLKSPLFAASDDDLMLIAAHKSHALWFERMAELHTELAADHPIHRAHLCINRWRALADKIPVHDLLDRIYSEANVLARYQSSSPDSLKPRVQANLVRFMELALDLDSGRYPSLMHFLQHLRSLKELSKDAPDEAPMETAESRVRIMTIHASKGLEAAVVFLADAITSKRDKSSISTLVDWPADQPRPQTFQLIPSASNRDSVSDALIDKQKQVQEREDAHLLYVAITRAKQYLFISACQPDQGPFLDWYAPIKTALQSLTGDEASDHLVYRFGETIHVAQQATTAIPVSEINIPAGLSEPFIKPPKPDRIIAPSKIKDYRIADNSSEANTELADDADAQIRGIAMHRCLDLLTRENAFSPAQIRQTLAAELELAITDPLLNECLHESQDLINNATLNNIFKPATGTRAYNELPLHYLQNGQMVYGIIDRLLVNDNNILLIDYKSHTQATAANLQQLAEPYYPQMQLYAAGISKAWPEKKLTTALLFTHCAGLHYLNLTDIN
ncbi:MAG: UvrD-helicase domain-containing protein [Gammaproteobacteria bacterium]|nr:UvrD-helicase domain-containing protein [Gammaproteobacteria bacterium]